MRHSNVPFLLKGKKMEIISKVLFEAFDVNLSYVILLDIVLGFMYGANILLSVIINTRQEKFDIRKFFFGVLKAICVLLIILGVCYILNVFTLTLNLIEAISINMELVTTLEIILVLVTYIADISAELLSKIKSFREIKYISQENITLSDTNIVEPMDFKG